MGFSETRANYTARFWHDEEAEEDEPVALGRMRLLPRNTNQGWLPYIFLPYLAFFFIPPLTEHFTLGRWLLTLIGTAIFLICYFRVYWVKDSRAIFLASIIALLGFAYTPFNGGAICFFIYAAAFYGFFAETKNALLLLSALIFFIALQAHFAHLLTSNWLSATALCLMTGLININFRQRFRTMCELRRAREEVESMTKIAERERIARDLHDILGHTLSVIILKSELASKLIDRDVERARSEILDVERTSRQALAEVRQAIGGFRALGLVAEIEQARATLATAGVKVECDAPKVDLSATQESVLALAIKEATTNIVRHAKAATCRLQLRQHNGACYLQIQDDGCGTAEAEGNGLRGMRERVEALGGSLRREIRNGTELHISLPLNMEV